MSENNNEVSYKDLTEDYKDLYEYLLSKGDDRITALGKIKDHKDQEQNYRSASSGVHIRVQFPEEQLLEYGWGEMTIGQKNKALWTLGVDISRKWYTTYQRIRVGTDIVFKNIVWGTERLDKEWLTKRRNDWTYYASDEARDAERNRKDPEYMREISKLSM